MSNSFEELKDLWQDDSLAEPGSRGAGAGRLVNHIERFDRKVFWRNLIEYAAVAIVLVRSVLEIESGERPLIIPLTSIAVGLYIAFQIWIRHRDVQEQDTSASAAAYREALLRRVDRQLRFARTLERWYYFPAWIFFLVVYLSGVAKLAREVGTAAFASQTLLFLSAEFLLPTCLCLVAVWANRRFNIPKLERQRKAITELTLEDSQGDSKI